MFIPFNNSQLQEASGRGSAGWATPRGGTTGTPHPGRGRAAYFCSPAEGPSYLKTPQFSEVFIFAVWTVSELGGF